MGGGFNPFGFGNMSLPMPGDEGQQQPGEDLLATGGNPEQPGMFPQPESAQLNVPRGAYSDPEARKNNVRELLGNFVYALGKGMAASGSARPGFGALAGFGEALAAGPELGMRRRREDQQVDLQRSTIEHRQKLDKAAEERLKAQDRRQSEQERRNRELEELQRKRLEQPRPTTPHTITTDEGVMQYNAETGKFDILVGSKPKASERPTAKSDIEEAFFLKNRRYPDIDELVEIKARLAAAGRPAGSGLDNRGSFIPLTDAQGNVTGAWNPKTEKFVPIPQDAAGSRRSGQTGTEITRQSVLVQLKEDMQELGTLAKRNTDRIGPISGRWESVKANWLTGTSEDSAAMQRIAGNAQDMLLRARSGAQINETEYRRLSKLVPDPKTPPSTFFTNLRLFQQDIDKLVERTVPSNSPARSGGEGNSASRVRVVDKDGKMFTVPVNQLGTAISRGYKRAPE